MPRDWMDPIREQMLEEADRIAAAQRQEREASEAPSPWGTWALVGLIVAGAWMTGPVLLALMVSQ